MKFFLLMLFSFDFVVSSVCEVSYILFKNNVSIIKTMKQDIKTTKRIKTRFYGKCRLRCLINDNISTQQSGYLNRSIYTYTFRTLLLSGDFNGKALERNMSCQQPILDADKYFSFILASRLELFIAQVAITGASILISVMKRQNNKV